MPDAKEIPPNEPLEEGHMVFQGMVRPTKGGYEVRGVIIDDARLSNALAHAPEARNARGEWFLGAVVRITGELEKHEAKAVDENGVVMQMRSGTWFELERLEEALVVAPAEIIEGTLTRSKGFFAVGNKLISEADVAWSLGSMESHEGDRVRLYGQSRTEHCEPNAQCLIQGSLPLFDVGHAERLP